MTAINLPCLLTNYTKQFCTLTMIDLFMQDRGGRTSAQDQRAQVPGKLQGNGGPRDGTGAGSSARPVCSQDLYNLSYAIALALFTLHPYMLVHNAWDVI